MDVAVATTFSLPTGIWQKTKKITDQRGGGGEGEAAEGFLQIDTTCRTGLESSSPDEVFSADVGADHLHAAGVDQRLDAQLHTGSDDVLRAWEEETWSEGQKRNRRSHQP